MQFSLALLPEDYKPNNIVYNALYMQSSNEDAILQAEFYLQMGLVDTARDLLFDFVRSNPGSEQGWLLLSQALSDPHKQADCLRQVLKINPANSIARQQLALISAPDVSPPPPATPMQQTAFSSPTSKPDSTTTSAWQQSESSNFSPSLLDTAKAIQAQPAGLIETSPSVKSQQAPKPRSPARQPSSSKKKASPLILMLLGGIILVLVAACPVAGYLVYTSLQEVPAQSASAGLILLTSAAQSSQSVPQLPATWTPTPTATVTPTPTITPTPVPSPTPTFLAPAPTAQMLMDRIQKEVSDLRGLPIKEGVPSYIVAAGLVEEMVKTDLENEGYLPKLEDEARVLSTLGLIKPTYDLVRYTMNGLVDNFGGFYRPEEKDIYLLSINFGGVEHFIYAHEFDHALADQNFDLLSFGVVPDCLSNDDRCTAVRALVEGDATLAMRLWFQQYATPQDYVDIVRYRPPMQALPEQFPPDFVLQALNFPYEYGLTFVERLHKRGNWTEVNAAYQRLPETTEQIIHPEKYDTNESPAPVLDVSLSAVLGSPWREIANDVLGEWTTYLILAYGADKQAQVDISSAKRASAGWGGDQYQAYYNPETGQTVLAAHWAWDSVKDSEEFSQAMKSYLDQRFRGAKLSGQSKPCWEVNQQTTCLFIIGNETLWLVAPDFTTIEKVLEIYPSFR